MNKKYTLLLSALAVIILLTICLLLIRPRTEARSGQTQDSSYSTASVSNQSTEADKSEISAAAEAGSSTASDAPAADAYREDSGNTFSGEEISESGGDSSTAESEIPSVTVTEEYTIELQEGEAIGGF